MGVWWEGICDEELGVGVMKMVLLFVWCDGRLSALDRVCLDRDIPFGAESNSYTFYGLL